MLHPTSRLLLAPYLERRIHARISEKMQRNCPYIIVANHIGFHDTALLMYLIEKLTKRDMFIVTKWPIFRWKPLRIFLNCIPLRATPRAAYEASKKIVKGNHHVLIFPEGGINLSPAIVRWKTGATRLSSETQIPILPIGVTRETATPKTSFGMLKEVFFGKVHITIGDPIMPNQASKDDAHIKEEAKKIGQIVAQLAEKKFVPWNSSTPITLILEGGVMTGVFGAGVVTYLQKRNLYERIKRVYSSSAGAHNGAYFLSKQSSFGSRIYYEDLIGTRFIDTPRFVPYIASHIFGKTRHSDMVHLDYLRHVEKDIKHLDIETLSAQQVPLFAEVFDIDAKTWQYLDVRTNPSDILYATASAAPFTSQPIVIQGKRYIDGGAFASSLLTKSAMQHTGDVVIYVRNHPTTYWHAFKMLPFNLISAFLLYRQYGWEMGKIKLRTLFDTTHSSYLRLHHHLIFIEDPRPIHGSETKQEPLKACHARGMAEAERILLSYNCL